MLIARVTQQQRSQLADCRIVFSVIFLFTNQLFFECVRSGSLLFNECVATIKINLNEVVFRVVLFATDLYFINLNFAPLFTIHLSWIIFAFPLAKETAVEEKNREFLVLFCSVDWETHRNGIL